MAMRLVWNELTPNDRYAVRTIRPISFAEMGFLTHLYLPLIGMESYSLYQLLLHEVNETSGAASESTHRGLMLMMSLPLDRVLTARERLEAMGLLEVRRRENRQQDYIFEYNVKPPLAPATFFASDILPVMLHNQVGQARFEQIRRRFADRLHHALVQEYPFEENVTKSFNDVYYSLAESEIGVRPGTETDRFLQQMDARYPAAALDTSFTGEEERFNLSALRLNLPKDINAADIFTKDNIGAFYRLMHFYQLDSWLFGVELGDWTLYTRGQLDMPSLRKRLMQKYLDTPQTSPPKPDAELAPGVLPEPGSSAFARVCRQYSPLVLLEKVVGGRVNKSFLERAEALVFSDGMAPEVVNALLLHTLRSTQMELPKTYLETIRDSWKAKQITTVDDVVKVLHERAEGQSRGTADPSKPTKREPAASRRNSRAIPQDKLPASVQWQLEQEQAGQFEEETRKTVQDVPEAIALMETLRKMRKGEK